MLELLINGKNKEIALIENGKLIEFYQNTKQMQEEILEGNIYMAKVTDILPGMQAAFVDFGENKKGFIHLKDVIPQVDERVQKIDENLKIKDVLKVNDKILIQVKKDAVETKGARVSTHISIPSKYLVLMPDTTIVTISQKIENQKRKQELLNLVKSKLPKNNGAILRTSAEEATNEDIVKDLEEAISIWKDIKLKVKNTKTSPKLLFKSKNIEEKIITDLCFKGLNKVKVNDKSEYKKLKDYVEKQNTDISVELSNEKDLIESYDLSKQIDKLENRKIWLNCGGFITIDKTEALTAIDVNTGKFTGNKELEKTIFKVNREATIEIAKQLRLRDVGGIVIIDYIDMKEKTNRDEIENLLKECLKNDRTKTQVEGFTRLNLMEMTRKCICGNKEK